MMYPHDNPIGYLNITIWNKTTSLRPDQSCRLHVQGSRGAIGVGDFDLKGFHQELPLVAHDAAGQGSLATVLQSCLG